MKPRRGWIEKLQRTSLPLFAGAAAALVHANVDPAGYAAWLAALPFGDVALFGHAVDLSFLINDVFMAFFFGLAAVEIVDSCRAGGALSPLSKAVNPLFACLGGVAGPVAVFFAGLALLSAWGGDAASPPWSAMARGWGIPCATDIALAWLFARLVFGEGHPAIDYLLLLAIVDDAIGLAIIALVYGDPEQPFAPGWLALVGAGMLAAFLLRRGGARPWWPYVAIGGTAAWIGMLHAHVHPALALVPIVPFLPAGPRDPSTGKSSAGHALTDFEHAWKLPVDLGLAGFAYANAGVELSSVGPLSWLVLASLAIGKTAGIALFGELARRLGFELPDRVTTGELVLLGAIAGIGLTVALFVAGEAYADRELVQQAKMGALLSLGLGFAALAAGRFFRRRS